MLGASCIWLYLEFSPEIHGQISRITDFHCSCLLNDNLPARGNLSYRSLHKSGRGFPGSSVVKNLPASARDMDSIPRPGRSHMLRSSEDHVP